MATASVFLGLDWWPYPIALIGVVLGVIMLNLGVGRIDHADEGLLYIPPLGAMVGAIGGGLMFLASLVILMIARIVWFVGLDIETDVKLGIIGLTSLICIVIYLSHLLGVLGRRPHA